VNSDAYPEKTCLGGCTDKPVFKAVLIYENFAPGLRARWFCERLGRTLEGALEEKMWNFEVLAIRELRNAAASAARNADLLIVSVSSHTELPSTIRAWLDMWVWLLDKNKPALVALFDSSALRNVASIRGYLSAVAQRGGIDFFPHEITSPVRQDSVQAVRSSKSS
jgi:hypothetical protein